MSELKNFFKSLRIQARVIYALMMREIITRYGRENIGFLWLFLEPIIVTLGITIIWTYMREKQAHGFPVAAFIYTGWASNKLWLITAGQVMKAIEANKALLYHRNIKPIDLMLARILLEITAITGVFMILGFVFVFSHIIKPPYSLFHIVIGWYLMVWLGIGFSFFVSSLNTLTNDFFQKIWGPISLLLFISSGTFFLVEWIPPEARKYVLLLPSVHNVELIRYGFFGPLFHPYYDISYSVMFNLFLTFFGLVMFKSAEEKIKIE